MVIAHLAQMISNETFHEAASLCVCVARVCARAHAVCHNLLVELLIGM
jgi:hypothetical protein